LSNFQVAYIPIGVPTFHLESANDQFEKSLNMLEGLTNDGIYPEKPLSLNTFLADLQKKTL